VMPSTTKTTEKTTRNSGIPNATSSRTTVLAGEESNVRSRHTSSTRSVPPSRIAFA
jgi:hypothetical protein